MATIPTPEQGKPILDFSAGTFDGNSNLFQSRNGATEHVNGDDVADYVNTSRIYNGLNTTSKIPVGAINEVNDKEAGDIPYDNTASGLTATDVNAAIDEVNSDFVDNVCKGRTAARLTEITSSSIINVTRTERLQTFLVIIRGTNAGSYYVGLISGYGGGSSRNVIIELGKGNHIGTVSFLTSDTDDLTLSISMASSSISASLNILVLPFQSDDTFTITKT